MAACHKFAITIALCAGFREGKQQGELEMRDRYVKNVVLPRLELGISGPESDVLPLHHRTLSE